MFFDVVVFLPRRDRDGGGGGSERDTLPAGSTKKEEEEGKRKRELSPAGSTHNFLRCLIRGRRMASYMRSGGGVLGGRCFLTHVLLLLLQKLGAECQLYSTRKKGGQICFPALSRGPKYYFQNTRFYNF